MNGTSVIILALSLIAIGALPVSIFMSVVSLSPNVNWNKYSVDVDTRWNISFYFEYESNIWSSHDKYDVNNVKGSGFNQILNKFGTTGEWKSPIRFKMYIAVSMQSLTWLVIFITVILQAKIKTKPTPMIVTSLLALASGATAAILMYQGTEHYTDGIKKSISTTARLYYSFENEQFGQGYNFARYSIIPTCVTCALLCANIVLYSIILKGEYTNKRRTNVQDGENAFPK